MTEINIEKREIPTREEIVSAVKTLIKASFGASWNSGWHHDLETGEVKNASTLQASGWPLLLMITEVAEAAEGMRKNLADDKLPQYPMAVVEIDDMLIRGFDFAGNYELHNQESVDIFANAFVDKLEYNMNREDHKLENRLKQNGKKV